MGFLNSIAVEEGYSNGRGLSPALWHKFPGDRVLCDPGAGIFIFDDFQQFAGAVDSNVGAYHSRSGAFYSYEDTSASIAQVNDERSGAIKITTPASDNAEAWLQAGGATSVQAKLLDANSLLDALWCEMRLKWSTIANTTFGSFAGLGAPGLAVANTIADGGTLVDKDLMGFFRPEGDGDGVDFVHRLEGEDVVTTQADMTIVADTWTKFGFRVEPKNSDGARLTIFQDNVKQSGYVDLRTIPDTFPASKLLSFLIGMKNAAGTSYNMECDWFALGMTYQS